MKFQIDDSELRALAVDMRRAGPAYADSAEMAVNDAGARVRDDWRADAQRSRRYFRQIAPAITRTTSRRGLNSETEVGPVLGGAGSLANIWINGGANGGGGGGADPQTFLDKEGPRLASDLAKIVGDVL